MSEVPLYLLDGRRVEELERRGPDRPAHKALVQTGREMKDL